MEKRNVNTNLVAALLVVIAVLGYGLIGKAGNLEPSAPPDSTMKNLQEIYDAVEATQTTVVTEGSGVSQREGYCGYFPVGSGSQTIFTVDVGKRFVLLRLDVTLGDWTLTVNDTTFIYYPIMNHYLAGDFSCTLEFPDRCVVVDGGDTLKFVYSGGSTNHVHIIGYFYDVP
jgi:hypothetical protein